MFNGYGDQVAGLYAGIDLNARPVRVLYGALHFLTYAVLDRLAALDFSATTGSWMAYRALAAAVSHDIYRRPFIAVGFTAFALMIPLAARRRPA
jgi:DMSO/TMAO reductase YedYZ heme-binding membrane subunit